MANLTTVQAETPIFGLRLVYFDISSDITTFEKLENCYNYFKLKNF